MTRRAAPLIALALTVVLALTGCGPVNAASGAQDAFTQHMEGQPGVAEVTASGSNTLPFTGSVDVVVSLDQGSDTATLTAVVDRMASFVEDYPYQVSWTMSAELDGFTLSVVTDGAANEKMIALFGTVRSVDGVVGGSLSSIGSTITIAVAADAVGNLERLLALDFTGPVTVLADDGTIEIASTEDGALPAAEIAAVDAVAAQYTILTAVIHPGSVELRLLSDPDVAGASTLVKSLPGAQAIVFTITGGIVTREGEGSFARVNPIIEQATAVPDVVAISAEPDVLGFTVTTTDAVAALEQILASTPSESITVYYRSAEGQEPGFSIYGPTARRATYLPIVTALVSSGYVSRIDVYADRIDVVAGDYDEARMGELAAELKTLLPDNTDTRLTNTSGGVNFSFTSGASISVDSDESYGDVDAQGFVDAWNAAP